MPRISVCATCYNHERFIPEFMDSVLAQTMADWELNVVDDCSTDGSFALLRKYAEKDARIHVVQNDRNRHLCHTGNRAVAMATGELVTILSCDDVFLPDKFAYDVEFMARHPETGALYNEPKVLAEGTADKRSFSLPKDFSRPRLLRLQLFAGNSLTVPGLTVRRDLWRRIGGYDPLLRMTQDYELHLKILERAQVARTDRPTVGYRLHGGNLSNLDENFAFALANEATSFLPRHYLNGVMSVNELVQLIPECREYGEPCPSAIPYFIARFAVEHGTEPYVRFSGLTALFQFMSSEENRMLVEDSYGFLPKDLMKLSELPSFSASSKELLRTKSSLELIEKSVSYRLGMALTCPLRKAYRLFRPEKGGL